MKRILLTAVVVLTVVGVSSTEAKGPKGGSSGGSSSGSSRVLSSGAGLNPVKNTGITRVQNSGVVKSQVLDKKVGGLNTQVFDKKVSGNVLTGKNLGIDKKITTTPGNLKPKLNGNVQVAKLPGFKTDGNKHQQLLHKHNVAKHLHSHCFFHHDFCYNHCCWFPHHHCCGYWHPYARCWYYWYEPYCCYLPITYVEQYVPVAAAQPESIVINVNNNANANADADEDVVPTLPPGATVVPQGVNPMIPAPKG